MASVLESSRLGRQICEALGLKSGSIRQINIHVAVNELITVTVEYFPEKKNLELLPAILEKYELVKLEDI